MKSELLKDVLKEGDYADFREDLLARTLSETRQRGFRGRRILLAVAAGIALIAGVWMSRSPAPLTPEPAVAVARPSVPMLRTVPLQAAQILETRETPGLAFATDASNRLPSISDNELLALFPKRPVGLAGRKFFFLNARDAKEFLSSN